MKLQKIILFLSFLLSMSLGQAGNVFQDDPDLKKLYYQYLEKMAIVSDLQNKLGSWKAEINKVGEYMEYNWQNIQAAERKRINSKRGEINKIYNEIAESILCFKKEQMSRDTYDDASKKITVSVPYDQIHDRFIDTRSALLDEFKNRSGEEKDKIKKKIQGSYLKEVLDHKSMNELLGKVDDYTKIIQNQIVATQGLLNNANLNVPDIQIVELPELDAELVKYYIDEHIFKNNQENSHLLCPSCSAKLVIQYSLQEVTTRCKSDRCGYQVREQNKNNLESLVREIQNLENSDLNNLQNEINQLEMKRIQLEDRCDSRILKKSDIDSYVQARRTIKEKLEEIIKTGKRKDQVVPKNQKKISENVLVLPLSFDFKDKSMSDCYVDLVILKEIDHGICGVDQQIQSGALVLMDNNPTDAKKLRHHLKNASPERKSLIAKYLWKNREGHPDLLSAVLDVEKFAPENEYQNLDNIIGMLRYLEEIKHDGEARKNYICNKKVDLQLLYFMSQHKANAVRWASENMDEGIHFVFDEGDIQQPSEDEKLKYYWTRKYNHISLEDIDLVLSYTKQFEHDCTTITHKDIEECGLKFETLDTYLAEVVVACMHFDSIINNTKISRSEKIHQYHEFIQSSPNKFCQMIRDFAEDPVKYGSSSKIYALDGMCDCQSTYIPCNHKKTYALITHCFINYASSPDYKVDLGRFVGNNSGIFTKDEQAYFGAVMDASEDAVTSFEKIARWYKLSGKFPRMALYNIVKHRSDLRNDNDMNFKSVAKHLLVPCLAKIIDSGTCDISILKETLGQTLLVVSDDEIPTVVSTINKVIKKEGISQDAKNVLIQYRTYITDFESTDKRQFNIWGQSDIGNRNLNEKQKKGLLRTTLLTNTHHDFRSSLKKLFFQNINCKHDILNQLNTLVENNPEKDTIEEAGVVYKRKRWESFKKWVSDIFTPYLPEVAMAVMQKVQMNFNQQDPLEKIEKMKELKQLDERNKSIDDIFFSRYCTDGELIKWHNQEKEEQQRSKYDAIKNFSNYQAHFQELRI